MTDLTSDQLSRHFIYDPDTGAVSTKAVGRRALRKAGYLDRKGYLRHLLCGPGGRSLLLHRVAWTLFHGEPPKQQIDHINGDKADNRIENLRDVSMSVNAQNRRRPMTATGFLGVTKHQAGRFQAQIRVGDKNHYLGLYDTPEEAHAVYVAAKRELHEGCSI